MMRRKIVWPWENENIALKELKFEESSLLELRESQQFRSIIQNIASHKSKCKVEQKNNLEFLLAKEKALKSIIHPYTELTDYQRESILSKVPKVTYKGKSYYLKGDIMVAVSNF
jgi:hypothetical protein